MAGRVPLEEVAMVTRNSRNSVHSPRGDQSGLVGRRAVPSLAPCHLCHQAPARSQERPRHTGEPTPAPCPFGWVDSEPGDTAGLPGPAGAAGG